MRKARCQYYNKVQPRTDHEGADGEWRFNSTLSLTSMLDRVKGQLYALAALLLSRDPVNIVPVWTCVENLVPTGIRSPDRSSRS